MNHVPEDPLNNRRHTNTPGRILITAGPTHEPIDDVRYLANRSSGRLGIEVAKAAASRGWSVTLLLGPTHASCDDTRVNTIRFRTTADLEALLAHHFTAADVLVMAAAVADYRPRPGTMGGGDGGGGGGGGGGGKIRREKRTITLELDPTPDLLAGCAQRRVRGQLLVGFALEPRERLLESAREKLDRKKIDLIVANPLETMDSPHIEAALVGRDTGGGAEAQGEARVVASTPGAIPKEHFAPWLIEQIEARRAAIGVEAPATRRIGGSEIR